jgi:sterol desaturase/sphingolipid hydroxylase (fatty acid hydroxylase superfamily)
MLQYIITFGVLYTRNYLIINIIDNSTINKIKINKNMLFNISQLHEFNMNVITTTIIETGTFVSATNLVSNKTHILYDLLLFIPTSFIFEIIFDFFHYWTHRMIHMNTFLYKNIHKKHHINIYPTTILAFYQDPFDLILTNSIPFLLTLIIVSSIHIPISIFTLNMIVIYKSYIEISGHCGKKLYPSGSFPQYIWLPRFFDIQLYTEDHDYHHTHTNCNFGKRFTLWDKVFGTYNNSRLFI